MGAKSAVNHPMNTQQRDADINTKLQLYGIYSAFAKGKLPSNKQCDVALNSAIKSKWLSSPSKELSEEGRTLVKDLRDVIDKTKLLFLTKNEGELLQEFIWDAQQITGEEFQKITSPANKESARGDADRAAEGFKTLGTLLITNGEFRKLLSDAVVLLRDIAGETATKAASKLRPDEDALARIDQPAEDNVWHDKPDINTQSLKAQFKEQTGRFKPGSKQDVQEAAQAATTSATGGRQDAPVSQIDARAGGATAKETLQQRAEQNVAPEDREKAQQVTEQAQAVSSEYSQRTKDFLASKMPKERREQVVWRLKKMIVEIQGHSDYQQAIETLLSLAETYAGHGREITSQGTTATKGFMDTKKDMLMRFKTLIERFANSTSTDDFFDSLNTIYRDADQDPRLKDWFKNVDSYTRKCLREQGFIMQDEATDQWNKLYDEGRFLLRDRYRSHTDRIADEAKFLATQFDEDPQNRAFRQSLERLFKDLGQDQYGKPTFKPHLIKDISNVILPEIFENVRYIPIPRIEVSDPAVDMVIENLVIESDNLMPNVFELGTDNYWRWGRKKISNIDDHKVMISASGIQADLRDVSYYLKKKQGFPSLTDIGVMDILLGGTGFGFKIAASKAQKKDRNAVFKLDSVKVDVKNLSIKLKKSKHKMLFSIFRPMLLNVVRPALEKVLESQIREAFQKADAFAYQVQTEAQRAQEALRENPDPENAKNIFARYADAARQVITEKKKQAEAIAQRGTKVQMAMTHDDAMFKDIKLPGGVTTKATEYKELSAKGDRWQSPVFDWGAASPTSNLPKPDDVTRKPHTTAESRLQEKPQTDGVDGVGANAIGTGAGAGAANGFHGVSTTGATASGSYGQTLLPANGVTSNQSATNGAFKKEVDRAFDANSANVSNLGGV